LFAQKTKRTDFLFAVRRNNKNAETNQLYDVDESKYCSQLFGYGQGCLGCGSSATVRAESTFHGLCGCSSKGQAGPMPGASRPEILAIRAA
jgi:hypothetical protein